MLLQLKFYFDFSLSSLRKQFYEKDLLKMSLFGEGLVNLINADMMELKYISSEYILSQIDKQLHQVINLNENFYLDESMLRRSNSCEI